MLPAPSGGATAASAGAGNVSLRWLEGAGLAVFLLVLLAVIPSPSKFHSDEQFYTDSAIQMIQTGDYWTPIYPDGRIRLLKPILSYWAPAFSMRIFGISLFAVRLPFALAGVLTVFLTYRLACTLVSDRRTALLAALVLASNVQMMTLSTRATPDALVCLFVLMSMWGFARIWLSGDQTWVGPMLVYGGMGLAVQTKGLLGLCPVAAAALFWLLARPAAARTRRLLHWPAIFVGFVLGAFWYAVMLQRHGLGSFQDFFSDQVGAKVTYGPAPIVTNLVAYFLAGLRHFLPWTLLLLMLLILCRQEVVRLWQERRSECLFLLSLYVVLVFAFSFGNMRRTRYLVAAYPMLSVFLAMMLSPATAQPGRWPWFGSIIKIAGGVVLALGSVLLAGSLGGDWRLALGGGVSAAIGIAGILAARSANEFNRWTWIASVAVAVFAVVGACVRPAFSRSPIAQTVAMLRQETPTNTTVFSWQTPGPVDAQIRLLSGGKLNVKALEAANPDFSTAAKLITTSEYQTQLSQAGYTMSAVTVTNGALAESWLGRMVAKANAKRNKQATAYWVGVKIETAK